MRNVRTFNEETMTGTEDFPAKIDNLMKYLGKNNIAYSAHYVKPSKATIAYRRSKNITVDEHRLPVMQLVWFTND